MKKIKKLLVIFNMWRIFPCFIFIFFSKFKDKIKKDLSVWYKKHDLKNTIYSFGYIMVFYKEYRNLYLNRLRRNLLLFIISSILFPPEKTLCIFMEPENIGGGMYIEHGIATIISAKEIGENFHVNQQVTIGYKNNKNPIIKNNVTVYAGSIIVGNVCISDNVIVGAGSVVVKSIDENTVVAGVPATKIH